MLRKGVVFLILTTMVLHCASRVGFLSFLYKQRHEIAYTIGVIAEVPIAMCNSDYDFNGGLTLETSGDEESIPPALFQAKEINLFFSKDYIELTPQLHVIQTSSICEIVESAYQRPAISIFHPPS